MNKLILSLFICSGLSLTVSFAQAKLSVKNAYEFSKICQKRNRNLKNYADICACQKKNFSLLVADKQWADLKAIYTEKMSKEEMKKREDLSAVDFLIVTVENKCSANQSYLAPKAKMLLKKLKR